MLDFILLHFGTLEGREGNIWLGGHQGVGRYDGADFKWLRKLSG